jgi:hypothetical protein
MTTHSLNLTQAELKKILTIRAKGRGTDKDIILEYIKELAIKYDYIPLAPYTYVQYLMSYLKSEKDPLRTLKDLAFIILSHPEDYIAQLDEKRKELLKLLRWAIHALQLPLTITGHLLYEFAKAIDYYLNKSPYEAEEYIAIFQNKRKKEDFRKHGFREALLIMDILISTNFARQAHLDELIRYIYKTSFKFTNPKTLAPTFQTKLLIILAPLRAPPSRSIQSKWAKAIIEIGIETRRMITRLFKEGVRSPMEVYDQIYKDIYDQLEKSIGGEYVSKAMNYASTALFDDIVLTKMYLMHYKILGGNIIEALTLFRL